MIAYLLTVLSILRSLEGRNYISFAIVSIILAHEYPGKVLGINVLWKHEKQFPVPLNFGYLFSSKSFQCGA